ncbi:MAG: amidohydrolase [Bacillota bacterium]
MIDILITNATIVTVNPKREILYDAALAIRDGRILELGDTAALVGKYPDVKKTIDATGKAVFPGMINTHNHLFQTNLKGMGDDKVLKDWLTDVPYPNGSVLIPEDCYTGAMIGCIEGIRSGITTQLDYMYPHPVDGVDDAVIKAFIELGIRGIFGRGYMDCGEQFGIRREIMQSWQVIERDIRRLHTEYQGKENGRISIWTAPAIPWGMTVECLKMTKRLYDELDMPMTIHTAETMFDRESTIALHGVDDMDILVQYGLLGPKTLLVHCVQLTDRDLRMIKYYGAKVSHNPNSNMYLSSGVAPIPKMNMAGIDVSLGTDGAASNNSNDMLEILKSTALLQKVTHRDPTILTADKVFEMATIEGARCVGMENEIGSLEAGKKADLFIFNPERNIKAIPMHHPVSTLVYSSTMENVETLMVDGNILMEDGVLTMLDEKAMIKRCRAQADELSKRANTLHLKKRPWKSLAY